MYNENELLMLSGLQHLVFCERQWGLIHLEGQWAENRLTAEGRLLHEKTHQEDAPESRGDVLIARGLRIHSLRLGLIGMADTVEYQRLESESEGVAFPKRKGRWLPYPVEYKRGKPKPDLSDEVQLCAQAICLEEMQSVQIPQGAIFYGRPRRRTAVQFDEALREETRRLALRMHQLFDEGKTPAAVYEKKCRSCSLFDLCRPQSIIPSHSAKGYLKRSISDHLQKEPDP